MSRRYYRIAFLWLVTTVFFLLGNEEAEVGLQNRLISSYRTGNPEAICMEIIRRSSTRLMKVNHDMRKVTKLRTISTVLV